MFELWALRAVSNRNVLCLFRDPAEPEKSLCLPLQELAAEVGETAPKLTGHNISLEAGVWSVSQALGTTLVFRLDTPIAGAKRGPKKDKLGSHLPVSCHSRTGKLSLGWVLRGTSTLRPLQLSPLRPPTCLRSQPEPHMSLCGWSDGASTLAANLCSSLSPTLRT